ncbi:P-loop containing nucleoside triphosphate hydrolase protein [Entophlyctis helioformis]|nr:P-loop containing nucleoside triphosphate hydrolase protein [Entophlyctis helioformis]
MINFLFGVFFTYTGTRAARSLHKAALPRCSVHRLPSSTPPLGRIINRFSKDQDGIDNTLIEAFRMFLETFILAVASFVLIIYATPLFAIPFVPVMVMYYYIQLYYRSSSREIKRIESIARSPIYTNVTETLNGIATIRAYGETNRFVKENERLLDGNVAPYFVLLGSTRWLSVRLESLGAVLVFFAATFGILSRENPPSRHRSLFTDTEIAMNAVERSTTTPRIWRSRPAITDVRPPTGWPATGAIEFKDVSMRTVSFTIRDKEKIGVVGRTGSGKSSLMQVLFRMDPVLFSGTFRRNLDPFGQHTDAELWDALERANIKTKVQGNGENLSVGQRQLLCLARAMLKRPRILIMDEATANVDYETEPIIQKCLREEFAGLDGAHDCHRLNTIMDYDRIVEFDSPQQLMANEAGVFRSMDTSKTLVYKDSSVDQPSAAATAPPRNGFFSRSPAPSSADECPEETANIFSQLTWSWVNPIISTGWKRPLQATDLWKLPARYRTEVLSNRIEAAWATEFAKHPEAHWSAKIGGKGGKEGVPGEILKAALLRMLLRDVIPIGLIKLAGDACTMSAPFVIKAIVNFVVDSKRAISNGTELPSLYIGFGYAILIFMLQFGGALSQNLYFYNGINTGVATRVALASLIYRKSTRLSAAARQEFNAGKVTNIVSTDVHRFERFILFLPTFFTSLLQILVITILLIIQIGPAALAGIALLALFAPLQNYIWKLLSSIRGKLAPLADARMRTTQEVLQSIRLIKYFTWEQPFLDIIEAIRKKEIALVLKRGLITAFNMTFAFSIPNVAAAVSFIIFGLYNSLEPGRTFAALAWFAQLPQPLMFIPQVITGYAEIKIALVRIQELLVAPEIDARPEVDEDTEYGVKVDNGEFVWDSLPTKEQAGSKKADETDMPRVVAVKPAAGHTGEEIILSDDKPKDAGWTLRNINLTIPRGKLVAVVGTVGSGKSSLLNALIGEMKRVSGTVSFSGSLGYAPQQAWIQNASVKDNILFGLPYDEARYLATIRDCALEKDLEILPDGDLTQIGERGINLSGGQKQRINIARLVYFNSQIALLDDPLSAVDAHVGRYLFDNCLQGALAGKTRILVTHQLHFLPRVDYVVVMKDGEVAEQGTYAELMTADGEFATLMRSYGGVDKVDETDEEAAQVDAPVSDETAVVKADGKGEKKEARELMQTEDRATGAVKGGVWLAYFRAAGGMPFLAGLIFTIMLSQGSLTANDLWLVLWTNQSIRGFSQSQYVGIYGLMAFLAGTMGFVFSFYLVYFGSKAGQRLHEAAARRVVRAPTAFFDTTPLGRIINRFSKDQDGIDSTLVMSFRMFLQSLASIISYFGLLIAATPLFIVPFLPVMGLYYIIQKVYRASSRELKRLESISRSPLYAHIGETLNGIATIRAYGEQEHFIQDNNKLNDSNTVPYFLLFAASRWMSMRFEALGSVLVFSAAAFGLIARTNSNFTAALYGLSLSYALQVTGNLSRCIRQFTETEVNMNAVERVDHYANYLEVEAAEITDVRPPTGWPATGAIEFKDVSMRYAPDLPLVLKTVSFTIRDKEKIGVVGRTGSGKSSLMQVLFRMVEPAGGDIVVDGFKTTDLGLQDLRSGLGIIPQDPVLFSGTFRRNLDPFGQHTDAELWDALERANIKTKVAESDGGLDGEVQENGENLSVGQRQLLCLARAMLKRPRILIMDEATANVDYETDAIIQKCLREEFADSTVLTIAHRLNTIMDYDRVMVLSAGEIVEFDSPQQLMANEAGVFRSMVDTTR